MLRHINDTVSLIERRMMMGMQTTCHEDHSESTSIFVSHKSDGLLLRL